MTDKGAITQAIEALEEIYKRHYIMSAGRDRDTAQQAEKVLEALKAFKDGVPEGLESGLMSISSPCGTYIGESWGCMASHEVNDAAKHLQKSIK